MLKPEQIPPDVMYAAWKAMNAGMTLNDAIAAALNAWPGMKPCAAFTGDQSKEWPDDYVEKHMGPAILLPIP